ncbi:MAG TPA: hypothetical protein VHM70_31730 [Polyangiaceae bacterium]|nr:hypothetical protein [Polyangiaceae bacterium]
MNSRSQLLVSLSNSGHSASCSARVLCFDMFVVSTLLSLLGCTKTTPQNNDSSERDAASQIARPSSAEPAVSDDTPCAPDPVESAPDEISPDVSGTTGGQVQTPDLDASSTLSGNPSAAPSDDSGETTTDELSSSESSLDAAALPLDPEAQATDASAVTECDPHRVTCKRLQPTCSDGQVPRVVNSCWGECVAIDECVCSKPEQCPNDGLYTCRNDLKRCTYYLR